MRKLPLVVLLPMVLLTGCLKLAPEVNLKPTLSNSSSQHLTTIQFSHPNADDVLRVIREYAAHRQMGAVPADNRLLGPGWVQERFELKYKAKGKFVKSQHSIVIAVLYKSGQATVQLLPSEPSHQQYVALELSLLETLKSRFGANNVTKIGG